MFSLEWHLSRDLGILKSHIFSCDDEKIASHWGKNNKCGHPAGGENTWKASVAGAQWAKGMMRSERRAWTRHRHSLTWVGLSQTPILRNNFGYRVYLGSRGVGRERGENEGSKGCVIAHTQVTTGDSCISISLGNSNTQCIVNTCPRS